jgi:hypothetical protein
MQSRWVAGAMGVAVGLLALLWWWSESGRPSSEVLLAKAEAKTTTPPSPPPKSKPRRVLPRPKPAAPAKQIQLVAGGGEDIPVITHEQVESVLPEIFREQVLQEVLVCLQETAPAEGYEGKMVFDLQFDDRGLSEAAIEELTELPDGLVDCVADAVWGAQWARLDQGEINVTWPVPVSVEPSEADPAPPADP